MIHRLRHLIRFSMPAYLIEDHPGLVRKIMKDFIVFRAEFMLAYDGIEYVIDHPMFPLLEEGYEVPLFLLSIKYDWGTPVAVEFSDTYGEVWVRREI